MPANEHEINALLAIKRDLQLRNALSHPGLPGQILNLALEVQVALLLAETGDD